MLFLKSYFLFGTASFHKFSITASKDLAYMGTLLRVAKTLPLEEDTVGIISSFVELGHEEASTATCDSCSCTTTARDIADLNDFVDNMMHRVLEGVLAPE